MSRVIRYVVPLSWLLFAGSVYAQDEMKQPELGGANKRPRCQWKCRTDGTERRRRTIRSGRFRRSQIHALCLRGRSRTVLRRRSHLWC